MSAKKNQPAADDTATSPLVASIDPRQLAASQPGDGTATDDIRTEADPPTAPRDVPEGTSPLVASIDPDQVPEGTSPLVASIDPDQLAVSQPGDGTETDDVRTGADRPPAIPEWGPADVSNVADPADPMTLTGHDAQPGEAAGRAQ